MHSHLKSLLSLSTIFALAATGGADILYTVKPLPDSKQVSVTVQIPAKGEEMTIQIPQWAPGFYVFQDFGKRMSDIAVTADGQSINADAVDGHTWKVASKGAKLVTFSYKAPMEFNNGAGHYTGASDYVYVVGRKDEKCKLHLDIPAGWNVAVGLDGSGSDYTAPSYDVLADNSVTMGDFVEAKYTSAGKPHTIAVRGGGAHRIDMALLTKECQFISDSETDFMGGAPYSKYVWQFNVYEGRGGGSGIEHLSSTDINVGSDISGRTIGLFAHEFFHLWNVKRIRSSVLGPFDYTKLPHTGALWWLEGVTDYFAQAIMRRYGWTSAEDWYAEVNGDVQRLRSQPGRLKVSPYESSYRVGDAAGGMGNSDGFGDSYYDAGFVAGMCLDIELITRSNGHKSLDDVEYALWKMCRNNQPGFQEDEIRKQLIKVGGPDMGPLYDQWVMSPGEIPADEELAKLGLEIGTKTVQRPGFTFETEASVDKAGMEVKTGDAQVPAGSIIRTVNGTKLGGNNAARLSRSYTTALARLTPGQSIKLGVLLPGKTDETEVDETVASVPVEVKEVRALDSATHAQIRLREVWTAKRRSF